MTAPSVHAKPVRWDTAAVTAHLQRRYRVPVWWDDRNAACGDGAAADRSPGRGPGGRRGHARPAGAVLGRRRGTGRPPAAGARRAPQIHPARNLRTPTGETIQVDVGMADLV
ncbi:hypothetical protein Acsp04_62620 [Actinomadura sp. NBRC 104425]|nr:hypothetical protein Acsp04_62620 [Actinomadura sp. NBRC 104425]